MLSATIGGWGEGEVLQLLLKENARSHFPYMYSECFCFAVCENFSLCTEKKTCEAPYGLQKRDAEQRA